jgi:GAF domain-containing protein
MCSHPLPLAQEIAEVTRLVENDDFASALDRFIARATAAIPGCDHAFIATSSRGTVETIAGMTGGPIDHHPGPGPVTDALTYHEPRRLDDVADDQRWPGYSALLAQHGFRSCLVLPLTTQGDSSAVLALFSPHPNNFWEATYDVALLFTLHAGVVFDNASLYHDCRRLIEQLRTAMGTRSLVGRAQGLLMRRFDHASDAAFNALRTASQNNNIKLREVAKLLIKAQETADLDATLDELGIGQIVDETR